MGKQQRRREVALPLKRDAFTAILKFMTTDGVTLRVEEQLILDRWIYCDALLRSKEQDEETIAADIAHKFGCSIFTARNDINHTKNLFARSRQLVKKYLLHLHLDRIDQDIERMRKKMFLKVVDKDSKEEYDPVPDSKDMIALAKLHETYTYTLNSMPEENNADKQPPPIFQFILAPGQVINKPMELENALHEADVIIMKEKDGIYSAE